MRGPAFQSGVTSGSGRERRRAVHRRDATVETKRVGLRREAPFLEHRVERSVLRERARPPASARFPRARDLVGRIAAQRDEVGHLRRIDAVALAHLVRADAGGRPARGCRTVTRSSRAGRRRGRRRDEHRSSGGLLLRRRPPGSRRPRSRMPLAHAKPWSARRPEAGRAARGDRRRRLAPALVRRAPCGGTSGRRACPMRRAPVRGRSSRHSRKSMSVKPRSAFSGLRRARRIDPEGRDTRGARRVAVHDEERPHARLSLELAHRLGSRSVATRAASPSGTPEVVRRDRRARTRRGAGRAARAAPCPRSRPARAGRRPRARSAPRPLASAPRVASGHLSFGAVPLRGTSRRRTPRARARSPSRSPPRPARRGGQRTRRPR